jgi:8-amino-7-oxononanoate synthase
MALDTLKAEGAAFLAAAAEIPIFTPRHRSTGPFSGGTLALSHGEALDLAGLDYLALGSEPAVKAILADSLASHDCAIPGSEAVIQTQQTYDLEAALGAYHFGAGTAATFTSGYSTNFALMEALGLRGNSHFLRMHRSTSLAAMASDVPTVFFLDGDLHFSVRHGVRFARKLHPEGCTAQTYGAGDAGQLEELLVRSHAELGDRAVRIIATDTVESATGREFEMGALCELAERYDCLLYADEAHAVGVLGPAGRGVTATLADFDRYRDRLIIMGTLTKAFCQPGGYAAMTDPGIAALLRYCGPQHVFSAPIAPWSSAAALRILDLVAGPFGDHRRLRLRQLADQAREGLLNRGFQLIAHSSTPILAISLAVPELADEVLEYLALQGFLVSIFQAPLRAIGQEVVRIGLRADLSEGDIDRLVQALDTCREKLRFC